MVLVKTNNKFQNIFGSDAFPTRPFLRCYSRKVIGELVLLLSLFFLSVSVCYGESDFNEFLENQKRDSLEFNSQVTDEEIIKFIEFQYKIDPEMLQQFRADTQDPEKLKDFLSNYRQAHNSAGIRLSTLKGMSPQEISQLEEIFEYKKKEHYESVAAAEKLQAYSKEQLEIVRSEGAKLIEGYEALKQGSQDQVVKITDEFPSSLAFLELSLIYLTDMHCMLFLQKGIGKGIGFTVKKQQGEWKLFTFNEYISWDRQEVQL